MTNGVRQFTVDAHRPVGAFDLLGISLLHRARLHQHAHRAGPGRHPVARRRPRRRATRSSSRAATPRSTPSRSPTSSTRRRSATASRRCSGHRRRQGVEGRGPAGRTRGAAGRLARTGGVYVPRFYDVDLPARRPDPAGRPEPPGVPWRVGKHTVMDLDAVAVPEAAARTPGRERARADERRDLPRLHPRLPVLPGRHDHPPGARAQPSPTIGAMVEHGLQATGFEEVGLLSLSSADHSEIAAITKGLADRYEGTEHRPVPAVDPRRRVQHRPRQRAAPATAGAPA